MSALSRDEVLEIAALARLELSDEEVERLGRELGQILEHMQALAAVDTTGVEPMTHAVPMQLRLRPDQVAESFEPSVATAAAPATSGGQFEVPEVIASGDGDD